MLAWYLDMWNWGSGKATLPSKKNPPMVATDYAEKKYGKGKGKMQPEEVDLADLRPVQV